MSRRAARSSRGPAPRCPGTSQKADGYVATIKNGAVTFRDGEWTGATPGGLIRGPQRAEMLEAAE
ncbi:hypothetical protein J4558_08425 [Leptolyngbya sp. 15MV]|nr:hypothetical protein J4558_08425 [Leptolyngbya sp. 15MV]